MPSRQILDLITEYISTKSQTETYPDHFKPGEAESKLQNIADAFGVALLQR